MADAGGSGAHDCSSPPTARRRRGRNINYFKDDELSPRCSTRPIAPSIKPKRTRLLQRAQRRIADLVPELPLYNITKLDAVPAALQNFKGNPTNTGVFWNVHEWEFR